MSGSARREVPFYNSQQVPEVLMQGRVDEVSVVESGEVYRGVETKTPGIGSSLQRLASLSRASHLTTEGQPVNYTSIFLTEEGGRIYHIDGKRGIWTLSDSSDTSMPVSLVNASEFIVGSRFSYLTATPDGHKSLVHSTGKIEGITLIQSDNIALEQAGLRRSAIVERYQGGVTRIFEETLNAALRSWEDQQVAEVKAAASTIEEAAAAARRASEYEDRVRQEDQERIRQWESPGRELIEKLQVRQLLEVLNNSGVWKGRGDIIENGASLDQIMINNGSTLPNHLNKSFIYGLRLHSDIYHGASSSFDFDRGVYGGITKISVGGAAHRGMYTAVMVYRDRVSGGLVLAIEDSSMDFPIEIPTDNVSLAKELARIAAQRTINHKTWEDEDRLVSDEAYSDAAENFWKNHGNGFEGHSG